jgi:hypothetical protein
VVGLQVFLRRADVEPVRVGDVPVQRVALRQEQREQAALTNALERVRLTRGHVIEDLGLEDVRPGVDQVRDDFFGLRLLDEALDPSVVVDRDETVRRRVLHGRERQRPERLSFTVETHEGRDVQAREDVSVEDEERPVQVALDVLDGPARVQRLFLADDDELHAVRALDGERLEGVGEVPRGENGFVHTVAREIREDVL